MKSVVSVLLCLVLLAGCSWRSLNPLNWFGGDRNQAAIVAETTISDGSVLITQILNATAERTPTGVILHATGLDATQGAFQAELRAAYAEDGAFSHLEFRIMRPEDATAGPPASRAIVAAGYFTRDETTALRNVTVRGALNSVTVNLR